MPQVSAVAGHRRAAETEDRVEVQKTPEAIHAVLGSAERCDFDRDCRRALGLAAARSSLEPVHQVIERWWRVATAAQQAHGSPDPDRLPPRLRTWDELRAERGR